MHTKQINELVARSLVGDLDDPWRKLYSATSTTAFQTSLFN